MASNLELENRIIALETLILNAVLIPKYTKDVTDSSVIVGDLVMGKKAGINDGAMFFGTVNTAPPTQDSHIDDLVAF